MCVWFKGVRSNGVRVLMAFVVGGRFVWVLKVETACVSAFVHMCSPLKFEMFSKT